MTAETCDQAACRTIYNTLVKFPTEVRLEAANAALEIVEAELGRDSPLYHSVKTVQVVCMVHRQVIPLMTSH